MSYFWKFKSQNVYQKSMFERSLWCIMTFEWSFTLKSMANLTFWFFYLVYTIWRIYFYPRFGWLHERTWAREWFSHREFECVWKNWVCLSLILFLQKKKRRIFPLGFQSAIGFSMKDQAKVTCTMKFSQKSIFDTILTFKMAKLTQTSISPLNSA